MTTASFRLAVWECARGGMADAPDLGSGPERGGGSSPLARTILEKGRIFCVLHCPNSGHGHPIFYGFQIPKHAFGEFLATLQTSQTRRPRRSLDEDNRLGRQGMLVAMVSGMADRIESTIAPPTSSGGMVAIRPSLPLERRGRIEKPKVDFVRWMMNLFLSSD